MCGWHSPRLQSIIRCGKEGKWEANIQFITLVLAEGRWGRGKHSVYYQVYVVRRTRLGQSLKADVSQTFIKYSHSSSLREAKVGSETNHEGMLLLGWLLLSESSCTAKDPLPKRMVPPTVNWALLDQLTIKTLSYRHGYRSIRSGKVLNGAFPFRC